MAAFAPAHSVSGKVYNIACGKNHSLLETYLLLAMLIGFDRAPLLSLRRAMAISSTPWRSSPRQGRILVIFRLWDLSRV